MNFGATNKLYYASNFNRCGEMRNFFYAKVLQNIRFWMYDLNHSNANKVKGTYFVEEHNLKPVQTWLTYFSTQQNLTLRRWRRFYKSLLLLTKKLSQKH